MIKLLLEKNEISTLNNKIKYDKLTHYFKSEDRIPVGFNSIDRPLGFIRKMKYGSIDLEEAK